MKSTSCGLAVVLLYTSATAFSLSSLGSSLGSLLGLSDDDDDVTASAATLNDAELANMKYFVEFAAASYCNSDATLVGQNVLCTKDSCPTLTANSVLNFAYLGDAHQDADGFVAIDDTTQTIVVTYKGTTSITDFVTDALFSTESCDDLVSGCQVHTGFSLAWSEVQSSTLTAVSSALSQRLTYSLVVTGHSLGGSIATLAGAYLRAAGYALDIYSYGSPRVGNEEFAEFVTTQAGTHYRVTHLADPGPRYPTHILGYRHTSPEYWLSTGEAKTVDYSVGDVVVCEGTYNDDCNGGTEIGAWTPHGYYFTKVGACKGDLTLWKRD
ncbi:Alpha/Beta hydrolase protein [Pseudomassariella vexata]|uniref:Alpha/Beta hydrolase protein n=1 Tax=Pseudomassariella vexata TaxID=1141098 RepID=A0A1Y2DD76_9PEZI|nr:Alpha/Beta hydrolase protein [Pseudomassariella vexata]ORY56645.1 Alpha/Beta hydrolase protein [Pseudomassariella vexata]